MKKCLILEDEELAVKRLRRILSEVSSQYEVRAEAQTIVEAVAFLREEHFDLIFMDIHLADGLSFDIFNEVKIKTPIIFTTAYDQYALQAFKQNSIDYLLKPIQGEALRVSLKKFEELYDSKVHDFTDFTKLLESFNKGKSHYKSRFLVQIADKIRSINTIDIQYFYAENKTVFVITDTGKRYYVNQTLGELEGLLDPSLFYRVNRKVILNIESIVELLHYSRSKFKVILKHPPSFDVFVPADKITALKDWLSS